MSNHISTITPQSNIKMTCTFNSVLHAMDIDILKNYVLKGMATRSYADNQINDMKKNVTELNGNFNSVLKRVNQMDEDLYNVNWDNVISTSKSYTDQKTQEVKDKIDQVFNPDNGKTEIKINPEISYYLDSDEISCSKDDIALLGKPNRRYKGGYSKNPIQTTSDANHKNTRAMTPQEIEAAKQLAELIDVFKWKSGGDRLHCGPTVQDVMQVFKDCGLKPFDYSFICYDKWDAKPEQKDNDGNIIEHAQESGEIYSFRKEELAMWVTRGLHERIKLLESK